MKIPITFVPLHFAVLQNDLAVLFFFCSSISLGDLGMQVSVRSIICPCT